MGAYSRMLGEMYYRESTFGNREKAERTFARLANRLQTDTNGMIELKFFWNK